MSWGREADSQQCCVCRFHTWLILELVVRSHTGTGIQKCRRRQKWSFPLNEVHDEWKIFMTKPRSG